MYFEKYYSHLEIMNDKGNINPYSAKLIYLKSQPLEVLSRYRDPQPQMGDNYSSLGKLDQTFTHFTPNKCCLVS